MIVPKCLKKIAPIWYKRVVMAKEIHDLYHSFGNSVYPSINLENRCIVGEAYGFSDKYSQTDKHRCDECEDFSLKFAAVINPEGGAEYDIPTPRSFKKLTEEFCKHMNKHKRQNHEQVKQ